MLSRYHWADALRGRLRDQRSASAAEVIGFAAARQNLIPLYALGLYWR